MLRRFAALLILLSLCLAAGCAAWRQLPEAKVLAGRRLALEGMDLVDRGDWENAEDRFAAALKLNPRDQRTHWRYGESLWRRGDLQGAARHFEECLALAPPDAELLVRLGRLRIDQGDLEAAEQAARDAVQADIQDPAAHQLLGDALLRQLRPREALAAYHRALDLGGPDAQLAVARIYRSLEQPRRVLATLADWNEDPNEELWRLRQWAYAELNLPTEARAAEEELARLLAGEKSTPRLARHEH